MFRSFWRLKDDLYGIRKRLPPSADKAILITGGTSGIGLALVKYFYKRGFSVIVTRHSRPVPEELLQMQKCDLEFNTNIDKPKMFFIHLDVTSQESIAKSYDEVSDILTKNNLTLHALVNNAGIAYYYKAIWMTRKQMKAINSTNFLGSVLMIRQYMPLLIKSPNSRVIHIGSGLAFFPVEKVAAYGATKAAMTLFMNSIALEFEPYNVRAVTVHVGDLIQNTSVLSNCKKDIELVYEDFSAEEKEIYRKELEDHVMKLTSIENWIEGSGKGIKSEPNIFQRIIARTFKYSMGQVRKNVQIEDSYTMKSFDNAIRMINPDKEIFAGNWLFTYFTGSFFESLDHVETKTLGYIAHKLGLVESLAFS